MRRYGIPIGVVVVLLVTTTAVWRLYLSNWRDDRAFQSACDAAHAAGAKERVTVEGDVAEIHEPGERLAGANLEAVRKPYAGYLQRFPNGRHAFEAEDELTDVRKVTERRAFKRAIEDALRSGAYERARASLLEELNKNPKDKQVLLQLAFLAWGVDRFHENAWHESMEYTERVLTGEPDNEIAEALKRHNEMYEPGHQLRAEDLGLPRGTRRWKAVSERSIYLIDPSSPREVSCTWTVDRGDTIEFFPDGRIRFVAGADGKRVWTVKRDPLAGWVWIDQSGGKYVPPRSPSPFPRETLREVTRDRIEVATGSELE